MPEGSWVQETAYSVVIFIIKQLAGGWSNDAWKWFSHFFSSPVAVLDDPLVMNLTKVSVGITLGCLPVAVAWISIREMLARMDGQATSPPTAIVRRVVVTTLAVTGTSTAAWSMATLADHASGVLAAYGLEINLLEQLFKMPPEALFSVLILSVVFLIGAVMLSLQRWVIAAEFTGLLILGPVLAAGLLREHGTGTWGVWLREMISLLITPLIQMLLLLLFLRKALGTGYVQLGDRALAVGLLYLLWNAPRWARQLTYSVGAADAVTGTLAGASRLVVMRHLMKAVTKV